MSDYPLEKHNLAANTIRGLAMDAVQNAGNGHPGTAMGLADVAVILWTQFVRFNPEDPEWPNRDRFVLSAGHAAILLYSLLHLSGYDLPLDEIKQLRQWGSITPGHPEWGLTPGVETTTGPLGQGISNAVGMAIAERWLAETYNRPDFDIIDHHTYVIASDGDLMEGISHEAAALAGHLGVGKLIVMYDDNHITIDGRTDLTFSDDTCARFEAYGWHTQHIDGHNPEQIVAALNAAREETERPSLVAVRTIIGYGAPNKQDTSSAHGEALGDEEVRLAKENLGWPTDKRFHVPGEVYDFMAGSNQAQAEWQALFEQYQETHPDLARAYQMSLRHELPDDWDRDIPTFEAGEKLATRASSGKVLNAIAANVPWMLGGSGDLTGSNNTDIKGSDSLSKKSFAGRYIHYGVREHGMAGIMNGMSLHGGVRPYGGTFLIFSDYLRPSLRLAALMEQPIIYVFTHDSIGLGEDGPTHQPISQLMALRAIPNMTEFRPADANETAVGWRVALENREGPTALVLTRQGVPTLDRERYASADNAARGAYVLSDADEPQVILIGTGSEVQLALEAQEILTGKDIAARVVSMPSWSLFDRQPQAYRDSVLPSSIRARVAIEAAATVGWERYVGLDGAVIGMTRFGASAPYERIFEEYGITAKAMAKAAQSLLQ